MVLAGWCRLLHDPVAKNSDCAIAFSSVGIDQVVAIVAQAHVRILKQASGRDLVVNHHVAQLEHRQDFVLVAALRRCFFLILYRVRRGWFYNRLIF